MTKSISEKEALTKTKRPTGALVRMKPNPREEMKLGKKLLAK